MDPNIATVIIGIIILALGLAYIAHQTPWAPEWRARPASARAPLLRVEKPYPS